MEPKEEIKQRIDIVDLIGESLTLKSAGGGSFRAVCPFHAEKTPSFFVSREKQIWHCFGCGVGGDAFAFVMQMEGVDFPEALRLLGEKTGVEIPRFTSDLSNAKNGLTDTLTKASRFYQYLLHDHPAAEEARLYLKRRGIDVVLAERFRLGVAPALWSALSDALLQKGCVKNDLLSAGLSVRRKEGEGLIDRFRDRIMIPLCDHRGQVVGFTGRLYREGAEGPKYMNSPETALYHKGELLFGLDLAKTAIRQEKRVIIVEGNLDVIASHKAGVTEVVASSGTALTKQQLLLLKRYTSTCLFCFDDDAAGFAAARRGIDLARTLEMTVKVVTIPSGVAKDPDELVQKDPEAWRKVIAEPVPIMQYLLNQSLKGRDLRRIEDKQAVAEVVLPELTRITDPIEQDYWVRAVADILLTDVATLKSAMRRLAPSTPPKKADSAPEVKGVSPRPAPVQKRTKEQQAARLLLGFALGSRDRAKQLLPRLEQRWLEIDPIVLKLYKQVVIAYNSEQSPSISPRAFFAIVESSLDADPERPLLTNTLHEVALTADAVTQSLNEKELGAWIEDCVRVLAHAFCEAERKRLAQQLRLAERAQDHHTVNQILEALQHLS